MVFGESAEGVEVQDHLDDLDDSGSLGSQAPDLVAGATTTISGEAIGSGHDYWGASEELSRQEPGSGERCPSAGSHRSKDSSWRPLSEPNPAYVQNLLSRLLNLEYSGSDDPNTMLVPIKRVYYQADWTDRGYLYRTDVEYHCRSAIGKTEFSCDDQELFEIVRSEDRNRDGKIDCIDFVEIIHRLVDLAKRAKEQKFQQLVDLAKRAKEQKFQQLVEDSNLQGARLAIYEQRLLWSTRPDQTILPWGWSRDDTPSYGVQYTSPLGLRSGSDPVIPTDSFTSLAFNAARVCIPRISQAQEKWGRYTAKMPKKFSNEYQEALELVLLAASNFVILESSHGPTKFSDLDNLVAMADLAVVDGSPEFEGCPVAILRDLQHECYNMLNAIEGFVFELKDSELKQFVRASPSLSRSKYAIKQDDCSDSPPSIGEWWRLQMPVRAARINFESRRWDMIQETVSNCRAWYKSHSVLELRAIESLQHLKNARHRLALAGEREMAVCNAEAAVRQGFKAERAILQVTAIAADGLLKPDLFSELALPRTVLSPSLANT